MTGLTILIIVLVIASEVVVWIIASKQGYDKGIEESDESIKEMYGIDEILKPRECKICGHTFQLNKKYMYIVKEDEVTGLSTIGTKKEPALYEAIDCPNCGGQILLGVRLRSIGNYKDVVEHYEKCCAALIIKGDK